MCRKSLTICPAAGGAYLAKAGLAGAKEEHAVLARFFAENVTVQAGALERTVVDTADTINGADAVLLA